jgi:hypothetical protein
LPAGYTIIIVVSVTGYVESGLFGGLGDVDLLLDFRSGDFGINVPGVYLCAFPM